MKMQMCARCQKRPAMVFITKAENGQTVNEGLCIRCAKDLGIKPISDMLEKFGISDEEFDMMTEQAEELMDNLPTLADEDPDGTYYLLFTNRSGSS